MKKTFLMALWLVQAAVAQTLTLAPSKTLVRAGESVTVTLTLSGAASPAVAAMQFDRTGAITETARVAGAASTGAGKTLTCTATGSRCVVAGVGATTIPNGVIMTSTVTIPANAVPGPVVFRLAAGLGASAAAASVPLSTGTDVTFTVLDPADLNSDGRIDVLDVTIAVLDVLSGTCASDQNGDGVCDVRDVQAVATKAQ